MTLIDAKAIIRDGRAFTVKVYADSLNQPTDFDCYTPEVIRSWEREEWQYVGLVVVDEETGRDESVWGMEYGTLSPEVSVSMKDLFSHEYVDCMIKELS